MAEDKKPLEKIKELIKNTDNIRNICTSAHIHHGKCVSGSTQLMLTNGDILTAKELFERSQKIGSKFKENDEELIYDVYNKKIEVFSLNKQTGKIEKKPIELAWKLQNDILFKITLRNGFEIATTPEHKYIVLENGDFVDKEAKDIKIGDRVVCARKLDTDSNIDFKKTILYKLSEKNFYVRLKEEFGEELKSKILKYGLKKIKTDIKVKSFYHGSWQKRYLLKDLLSLTELFNLDIDYIYNNIDKIFYRTGKQFGGNSNDIKLPQNFKELFYLAGLFIGDGSFKKFIVGKERLGKRFIEICNNLGINPILVKRVDRTPELHTNLTLIQILNSLFDYPLRQKSRNVRISKFVFNSPKEYIAQFLKAYFDCDGCVEKSRRAITLSSASNQMIDDLHLLLLRFGCVSIKEKDNTITISGSSAENFVKEIGFYLQDKIEKAEILVSKVKGSFVCDSVSVGNQVMFMKNAIKDKLNTGDLAYIQVKKIEQIKEEEVYDFTIPENHNFVAEGIVIHNTALTDNLLAASGYMSKTAAGSLDKGMATWQHADEQERLLTVDAANVSMIHDYEGKEYLINLIDTPGHVDFGGNVTRAMRAIDGTMVLVCAVEGIMPQTEIVVKQALRERVKPVLFINKVDRLINELKFGPEKMQERFTKIILDFNQLVERYVEDEFKEDFKVNIMDGSVVFGSARENWALSIPFMKKKNVTFKDIYNLYAGEMSVDERTEWTWQNAPLFEAVLDMVTKHLPNPKEAQKYRIPHIWKGDKESEFGKGIINCNPNAKPAFVITRITIDPKFGREISAGRLFSGTIKEGDKVYLNLAKQYQTVSQVFMYNGIKPEQVGEVPAGNVLALGGISGYAGETITLEPEHPFEELKHVFEPVITKSIEATKPSDLPKLIEILRKVSKEDPSIKIEINEETGENLMSGMGELHLEIIENRIKTEKDLVVKTSDPIVVYRESIQKKSQEFEGKSPNKHNKFFIIVEPLEDNIYAAIKNGDLSKGRIKKKDKELWTKLRELGVDSKEAQKYRDIFNGSVLIDNTRGIVHIGEIIEMIMDAFEQVMKEGPLAREPGFKVKVRLMDCKLHEDAIHRGPAQVLPAVRQSMKLAMLDAKAVIFEPVQVLQIEAPSQYLGDLSKLIQNKRGQLLDMNQEKDHMTVKAKMPVAEMFGLSSDLRSATAGHGSQFLVDQNFEKLPTELQQRVINSIRTRKGLKVDEDLESSE